MNLIKDFFSISVAKKVTLIKFYKGVFSNIPILLYRRKGGMMCRMSHYQRHL